MSEEGTTLKERLAELERVCEDFEKKLQLNKIKLQEVDLEVSRQNLQAMEPTEINIMCMEWAYYSVGVQHELNIANARLNWAESVLNRYLDERSVDQAGFSFSERRAMVVVYDSYAKRLAEFKEKCKMIVDRNMFITSKIDFLIKMAQNLAYSKRGEKNEG
jgi:hypothetical protein